MKKFIAIFSIILAIIGFGLIARPAFAEDENKCDGVPTAILGGDDHCYEDDGEGGGIKSLLNKVVSVMTIGIGVLGVLGITIVGIQYLTAGDSEEKTRKAKRRLFEIVIGLVAYVAIYALLDWLIPEFKFEL